MRKVFIDCGANRGQSLENFVRNWPDWTEYDIFSFEPDPRPFAHLQEKAKGLASNKINIRQAAAWIEDGEIDLYQSQDGDFGSSLIGSKKTGRMSSDPLRVQCFDLAKLLQSWLKEDYVILKVDVEGAEYAILPHLIQTRALEVVDVIYLEFHNWKVGKVKQDDENLLRTLAVEFPSLKVDTASYNGLNFI